MERKTLQFKTESIDEEQGIFEGYAAVFGNVDSGGDIIEQGAFSAFLEKGWERVKILALHNDAWLPIGIPLELREDDKGLYIKGRISDTAMGKDVKILLRDGVLNEMSIGYEAVTAPIDSAGVRHLNEIELFEVSLVTWAMNDKALVTGYKSAPPEEKAGRKISASRLQTLESARDTLKSAVKILDELIKDAQEQPEKSQRPKVKPETITFIF